VFKIGDLVRCVNPSFVENKGALGIIVGVDYDARLHTFPMYVVMLIGTRNTGWMHPNDIEGISLVDRARKLSVAGEDTT
jgi:hypothetical protein